VLVALALSLAHVSVAGAAARTVTLQWVGDIAFNTATGLPPGGLRAALAPVSRLLHGADLTMGNLEGTLSVGGASKCGSRGNGGSCFAFQAPPAYAFGLRDAGFDLLNQANNHAYDFGAAGQEQTLAALARAGLAHDGQPGEITLRRLNGLRIAVVGFAPYAWASNLLDIPGAQRLVRRAHRLAPIVVVIIHAGAEGADQLHTPYGTEYDFGEDRGNPRTFAHAVIDTGASIVLGSGPHVIRGIERYHHHLIAYSLGNFASWHTLGTGGVLSESAILRVTLNANGTLARGRWISIREDADGLPRPDPSNASAHLVAALSREDFARRYVISPSGRILPLVQP
jgi:poly-gamma-glutamate capsule biosynthesis protein CapA/YwtB (metallophosphatase superfamily)